MRLHFHKWGDVKDDGYQYCKKCNRAKKPINKKDCKHNWKKFDERRVMDSSKSEIPVDSMYVYQCTKCLEFRKIYLSDVKKGLD